MKITIKLPIKQIMLEGGSNQAQHVIEEGILDSMKSKTGLLGTGLAGAAAGAAINDDYTKHSSANPGTTIGSYAQSKFNSGMDATKKAGNSLLAPKESSSENLDTVSPIIPTI